MEINPFERFIRHCGTVEKAASVLGTSHQNVSSMRNGRTWVKYTVAQKIAKYLWEKEKFRVNPLDLISLKERNEIKSLFFSLTPNPIRSINVPIEQVTYNFSKLPNLISNQSSLNQLRTIIIDENNKLITNEETYFLYKIHQKKTIPAWKISLSDLKDGKYDIHNLKKIFDLIEQPAIGIALEKYLGERRGRLNVENSPHLTIKKGTKTRSLIAELLGFGSDYTYRQLKKILLHGDKKLIEQVRQKQLTPHAAYQRIKNDSLQPAISGFHL